MQTSEEMVLLGIVKGRQFTGLWEDSINTGPRPPRKGNWLIMLLRGYSYFNFGEQGRQSRKLEILVSCLLKIIV